MNQPVTPRDPNAPNMYARLAMECETLEEFLMKASARHYWVDATTGCRAEPGSDDVRWVVVIRAWWNVGLQGGFRHFPSTPVAAAGRPLHFERADAELAALECVRASGSMADYDAKADPLWHESGPPGRVIAMLEAPASGVLN